MGGRTWRPASEIVPFGVIFVDARRDARIDVVNDFAVPDDGNATLALEAGLLDALAELVAGQVHHLSRSLRSMVRQSERTSPISSRRSSIMSKRSSSESHVA